MAKLVIVQSIQSHAPTYSLCPTWREESVRPMKLWCEHVNCSQHVVLRPEAKPGHLSARCVMLKFFHLCPFQHDLDVVSLYGYNEDIYNAFRKTFSTFDILSSKRARVCIDFHFCYLIMCVSICFHEVEGSTLSTSLELSVFHTSAFYEIFLWIFLALREAGNCKEWLLTLTSYLCQWMEELED